MDSWETEGWGIDVNGDSLIDVDLYALGARTDHKDLFVEVDAMTGLAPHNATLRRDSVAFAGAPDTLIHNPDGTDGVNLHISLSDVDITRTAWPANWWASFHRIKDSLFATQADRASPNAKYIVRAKKLVYRYCIFADTYDVKGSSGLAEVWGDDFMVTLGGWKTDGGTEDQKAGTFMHELGHTLGLQHGGQDDINFKPNFISIMNYAWQNPFKWTNNWRLDYSRVALPSLDESNLDESVGLAPPKKAYPVIAVPFRDSVGNLHWARLKPATTVDWTGDGDSTSTGVNVDINHLNPGFPASPEQKLIGYQDWSNLSYNFRNSPGFVNGLAKSLTAFPLEPEMTPDIFDVLDNLPPPKPIGQFIMDGLIDTSATLLVSNGGIDLHGRRKGSQLYVATNSARSQGADMFIFVEVVPNSLRSTPWSKTGQVAAWTTLLGNESTDNSTNWYDASATPLTSITVDSAASSIVEGVIDIELHTGSSPAKVYLAAGKYQTNDGGVLLAQAPAGNGDGNIDPDEFYELDEIPVGVEDAMPLPTEFALGQNFPNPFNPTTTIEYDIAGVVALSGAPLSGVKGRASTNVKLAVYDILGREVATLVDESKPAGVYTVQFDASRPGERGLPVPAHSGRVCPDPEDDSPPIGTFVPPLGEGKA